MFKTVQDISKTLPTLSFILDDGAVIVSRDTPSKHKGVLLDIVTPWLPPEGET